MNSCVLMAKIIRSPELRYTQDAQMPVAQMLVEFEGTKPEDPPSTLRVVGWGNLASEIQENYSEGDRIIIEGRLSMTSVERPEGFKEKRAELVASRIHRLDGSSTASGMGSGYSQTASPKTSERSSSLETQESTPMSDFETSETASFAAASNLSGQNLDDIPF
jgi:single-stranded DNA-binding protein